ncbi:MAG: sugar ABC transporter permease [Devosia sp.]|uniref:carbohydrate ABC transporter permease n=1 Tax=Devosia sp. TaxID=1871048 RepID=UPI001ACC13D9|nr:sugar ABC transporter permease [Devosia sp.]MBN9309692.1 sugar ABC transporter permease [Devosia sp.]MBN9316322.1 sugar ABC transporter permease [Devosia sp.]
MAIASNQSAIAPLRRSWGRGLIIAGTLLFILTALAQALNAAGILKLGLTNWRPTLFAFLVFAVAIGAGQVLMRGQAGWRALFILPAGLFTVAMAIFPTLFGLSIAFTDWNLASLTGQKFNGLDNLFQLLRDPFYWNAMVNMVIYVLFVLVEYAIAFALALLLNAEIRARKFWRVVFLIPLMLSPVAVSWMVGKSMLEYRFGPVARFARWIGFQNPSFFTDPWVARIWIEIMDAWVSIPFVMILLLAGLQALPKEITEAAKVDGASPWQRFWQITFPLMLPVSLTAIVLRIIFKLKLADIIITVTSGGPGGATDSVSSFIYREYRDRSNVGYGTMLAMFYLVVIVIFITVLLNVLSKRMRRMT